MNKIAEALLIEKVARSIESLRNKRYWQMLKRLHGGTKKTVKELRKTKDIGMYHATTEDAAKKILKTKLVSSEQLLGKGAYFGDMKLLNKFYYNIPRPSWMPSKEVGHIAFPAGKALLRIKMPSGLKNKQLYPNLSKVRKTTADLNRNFDLKTLMPENPSIKDLQNLSKKKRMQIFFGKHDQIKAIGGQFHISGGIKGNLLERVK